MVDQTWRPLLKYLYDDFKWPSLKNRTGRPILLNILPCWNKPAQNLEEAITATIMGIFLMLITATLAEGMRYFREGFETSAVLVVARNKIDVNTYESNSDKECEPGDEDCIRVVEEVVSPLERKRCNIRHIFNTFLYGIQCALQLQCLLGVLSLNVFLMASVVVGVFLGQLLFFWRPHHKPIEYFPIRQK